MPYPGFQPRASLTPDRWRTNRLRHGRSTSCVDYSPPTKANRGSIPRRGWLPEFRVCESLRTMPLGMSRSTRSLHSNVAPFTPHVTLIGSRGLDVKSRPNISPPLSNYSSPAKGEPGSIPVSVTCWISVRGNIADVACWPLTPSLTLHRFTVPTSFRPLTDARYFAEVRGSMTGGSTKLPTRAALNRSASVHLVSQVDHALDRHTRHAPVNRRTQPPTPFHPSTLPPSQPRPARVTMTSAGSGSVSGTETSLAEQMGVTRARVAYPRELKERGCVGRRVGGCEAKYQGVPRPGVGWGGSPFSCLAGGERIPLSVQLRCDATRPRHTFLECTNWFSSSERGVCSGPCEGPYTTHSVAAIVSLCGLEEVSLTRPQRTHSPEVRTPCTSRRNSDSPPVRPAKPRNWSTRCLAPPGERPPSIETANNRFTIDIGIFVHKAIEYSAEEGLGKESAMAFVRYQSQHSPAVISENHGRPKSGLPGRETNPGLPECESSLESLRMKRGEYGAASEDPRENPPTSGIVRRSDSAPRKKKIFSLPRLRKGTVLFSRLCHQPREFVGGFKGFARCQGVGKGNESGLQDSHCIANQCRNCHEPDLIKSKDPSRSVREVPEGPAGVTNPLELVTPPLPLPRLHPAQAVENTVPGYDEVGVKPRRGRGFLQPLFTATWPDKSPATTVNQVRFLVRSFPDSRPNDAAGRRVFSGISRFISSFHSGAAPFSPRFVLLGSQDLDIATRTITLFMRRSREIPVKACDEDQSPILKVRDNATQYSSR
ncbi:hypothetical protein PR048_028674 [Dryococelus australis]|uniref:Uncharacterized protein n=1 Tax=Dryococelus australis TaxID=614101 RepID=A0ABQ9GDR7_9NEOP|nr:hypothetical protein PR048_028674 [Dryococelus australis]